MAQLCGIVFSLLLTSVISYQPKGRVPRNVPPGSSTATRHNVDDLTTMRIYHPSSQTCLEYDGRKLVPATCRDDANAQLWKMVKDKDWHGRLRNVQYGNCLGLSTFGSRTLVLVPCNSDLRRTSWTCHFPLVERGKPWKDYDWGGMEISNTKQCVSVSGGSVSMQSCADYTKDDRQRIVVFGTHEMGICAKAGKIGNQVQNPSYYFFQTPDFHISWNTKWVRVHMTYSHNMYKAFEEKYGSASVALRKIHHHAQDTINMVDKLYRQIRFRIVLVGVEVFQWREKLPKATNSNELHQSVYKHSRELRYDKGLKFDTSIYYFDGDLFGAAGTASHNFCSQSPYVEVAIIATVGGDGRVNPRELTNILTHEVAHLLHSPHNFDPVHTCPSYHLYGGRCTLGGNDWPKAFSAGELANIRLYKYTCLDTKPSQNVVYGCGNGVIDPGEECDCGKSQSCLTSDPCCDGAICKLKPGKSCSTESCCRNCQLTGCSGSTTDIKADDSMLHNPAQDNYNLLKHWKFTSSAGTKVLLAFHMPFFEFEENCPYDYLEVRDGHYTSSRSLGKFCRSPSRQFVLASSNVAVLTYRADQTYESKFQVFATGVKSLPAINLPTLIMNEEGKCLEADSSQQVLVISTGCQDKFVFTKNYNLKHEKSGLCVVPTMYYRSYPNWAKLELKGDCLSAASQYVVSGLGALFHPISGKCILNSYATPYLTTTCTGSNARFIIGSGGDTKPPIPSNAPKYIIRHFGGLCLAANPTLSYVYLTRSCDQRFFFYKNGALGHEKSKKCLTPSGTGDNSLIDLGSTCVANSVFSSLSGALKHQSTGKCIHPLNGATYPVEGTRIVIYNGCDGNKLQFKFTTA